MSSSPELPSAKKRRHFRTAAGFAAKLGLSALLVGWVITKVDLAGVYASLRNVILTPLVSSLGCLLVAPFLFAARWRVLSNNIVPYSQSLRYTWVGFLYGALLPGGISGDIVKGASLALSDESMRTAALPTSILLDRIIGLFVLLAFFAGSCLHLILNTPAVSAPEVLRHFTKLGLTCSVPALVLIFVLQYRVAQDLTARVVAFVTPHRWLKNSLNSFWRSLGEITSHKSAMRLALMISLVIQLLSVLQNWLLLRSLHSNLALGQVVIVYTCTAVATLLPLSISGIGIREWVTVTFFAAFGESAPMAVAYAWLVLASALFLALVGGLVQAKLVFLADAAPRDQPGSLKS